MAKHLGPEQLVHGSFWGRMHGGYFSDPEVAKPLVEAVHLALAELRPDVIIDLGGGTGFLLSQLKGAGIGAKTALANLDVSVAQLEMAGAIGISTVCRSADSFRRGEVVSAGRKALWLMRSVLHYAGEAGLMPLLQHIRAQAEEGEFWVHQTACFDREADAACLNALYRRMCTGKWYPTVADLRKRLAATGWQTQTVLPAPVLLLESGELGLRYGLDEADLRTIGKEMAEEFGGQNEVFQLRPAGFQADLHYRIFVCTAA